MADANIPAGPSEEQVTEAKSLGWTPKENWRGDPEKFIDADTYLERGLGIHHVRTQLESERGHRTRLEGRLSETEGAVRAANAALEALQESHDEDVKAQVEAARSDLKSQLANASKDGDHEQVAELTDKLTQLNAADNAPPKEKKEAPAAGQMTAAVKAELDAWGVANPDFVKSPRKVALGNVIAAEMRAAGDKRLGSAFLNDVAAAVDKEMGQGNRNAHPKVEGGGGGGGGGAGGGGAGKKSYADLPAEAKAACDRQAGRLVGANRAHKDLNSWRASYANQYFKE